MKQFILGMFLVLAMGCSQKRLVLEAQVVSMTKENAGSAKELIVGEEVEERWCTDEEVLIGPKDGQIGLADQVIYKAQKNGNNADFITDVRIFREGSNCAILTGRLASAR